MATRILIQQALLRNVRIKGNLALVEKSCPACPHLEPLTKDANGALDAVEALSKILNVKAEEQKTLDREKDQ